jgi:hypothetical protein
MIRKCIDCGSGWFDAGLEANLFPVLEFIVGAVARKNCRQWKSLSRTADRDCQWFDR